MTSKAPPPETRPAGTDEHGFESEAEHRAAVGPDLTPPRAGLGSRERRELRSQTMGSLRAQRILSTCALKLAPALIAGLIVLQPTDRPAIAAMVAIFIFAACAAVDRRRLPLHLMPLGGVVARALAPLVGILLAWAVSLALDPLPVTALLTALLGAWVVLAAALVVVASARRKLRVRIALVGSAELALSLSAEIRRAHLDGYEIVGWVDYGTTGAMDLGRGVFGSLVPPRLGGLEGLAKTLRRERVDLLVYGVREAGGDADGSRSTLDCFAAASEACLRAGVRMIGANQLYEELFGHVPLATMNAAWFQYVLHPRFRAASPLRLRAFDLLVGTAIGIVALPIVGLAAIAIKLTDGGPVLYRQRRLGEGGREFEILKLRTMGVDAERGGQPVWSRGGDPRVTRVGAWLRRSHLDELPQIWNILRGEMSIVGPRPERPEFVASLERRLPFYDRRQLMRPGLTGWAQVRVGYAGSEVGTAWKLAHDLYYFKHRSVELDALILIETLVTPVRDSRVVRRMPDERFVLEAIRGPL